MKQRLAVLEVLAALTMLTTCMLTMLTMGKTKRPRGEKMRTRTTTGNNGKPTLVPTSFTKVRYLPYLRYCTTLPYLYSVWEPWKAMKQEARGSLGG